MGLLILLKGFGLNSPLERGNVKPRAQCAARLARGVFGLAVSHLEEHNPSRQKFVGMSPLPKALGTGKRGVLPPNNRDFRFASAFAFSLFTFHDSFIAYQFVCNQLFNSGHGLVLFGQRFDDFVFECQQFAYNLQQFIKPDLTGSVFFG